MLHRLAHVDDKGVTLVVEHVVLPGVIAGTAVGAVGTGGTSCGGTGGTTSGTAVSGGTTDVITWW